MERVQVAHSLMPAVGTMLETPRRHTRREIHVCVNFYHIDALRERRWRCAVESIDERVQVFAWPVFGCV